MRRFLPFFFKGSHFLQHCCKRGRKKKSYETSFLRNFRPFIKFVQSLNNNDDNLRPKQERERGQVAIVIT